MAPSREKPHVSVIARRTKAAAPSPKPRKLRSIKEIMSRAQHAVVPEEESCSSSCYSDVVCEKCGKGDKDDEILLCDKCDKGYHMNCVRPIVVRVPIGPWLCPNCTVQKTVKPMSQRKIYEFFRIRRSNYVEKGDNAEVSHDNKKRKRRAGLVLQKKRRRLLPYIPADGLGQRLKQMGSLASALKALGIEFSDKLTYMPNMAPRSANDAKHENGGMQVLCKEDMETVEQCKAMSRRGECPPLMVVYDKCEGFTVHADGPIRDMTFIAEYTGDVDYIKNREHDDCDSMMSLILAKDPSKSLVICPDKHGNIARFISGINNHTPEGRRKLNCKCVRYNVNNECRAFLVAIRDIAEGERLYYDYNGYKQEYPTHHFI